VTERRWGDEAQSSVELALVLPVVVLMALVIVQVGVIAHHQLLVVHVAREAVRAAAVSDDDAPEAARRAAQRASGLDRDRIDVQTTVVGDQVRVSVVYRDPTDVVLAGPLVPELRLTAEATMLREAAP
jgi:Flp pilus assembly protein TadG